MTDKELAEEIERNGVMLLRADELEQIIAALRRGPELLPSGEMVMVTEFMKPLMKYALGSGNGELLALLQKEYDGLLRVVEAQGRKPSLCPECGEEGPHYIPPQFGSAGFWTCAKFYGEDGRRLEP